MSTDQTPRLNLPYLAAGQAQKHLTLNEDLVLLDVLIHLRIKGAFYGNTPPGSAIDGDAYYTGAAPTGAWAGYPYKIAYRIDGGWRFFAPVTGLLMYLEAEDRFYVRTAAGVEKPILDGARMAGPVEITANAGALPAGLTGTVLRVSGANGVSPRLMVESFGVGGNIAYRTSNGTATSPTALTSGGALGLFSFFGHGATGYSAGARASIRCLANQNWTDTAQGTYVDVLVTEAGTATPAVGFAVLAPGSIQLPPRSAAPASPVAGQLYFDSGLSAFRGYNGSSWVTL